MIKINEKEYKSGYTHTGVFHADEVAATALLKILDPEFKVERGFNPYVDEDILVFDIGNGEFDHHAEPRELRENGIPYAAVGKLWRAVSNQFGLSEEQQKAFDEQIIVHIDSQDNLGPIVAGNPLSLLIASLNPTWDSNEDNNTAFWRAVNLCQELFTAWIERCLANNRAKEAANEATKLYPGLAISERYIPTQIFSEMEDVKFAICPSQRGGWQSVSIVHNENQILFPEEYRGNLILPDGWKFCHAGGFIATFETKEFAINASLKVIEEEEGE